jgi:hypothetical protein
MPSGRESKSFEMFASFARYVILLYMDSRRINDDAIGAILYDTASRSLAAKAAGYED